MLRFALQKTIKNKWLSICLLLGCVFTVIVIASIPLYTKAALQRMITADLEALSAEEYRYPGTLSVEYNPHQTSYITENTYPNFLYFDRQVTQQYLPSLPLPVQSAFRQLSAGTFYLKKSASQLEGRVLLTCANAFMDHITLTAGRLPSDELQQGRVIEVLAHPSLLEAKRITIGTAYPIGDSSKRCTKDYSVLVVGTYQPADTADLYWNSNTDLLATSLIMQPTLFETLLLDAECPMLSTARWIYSLDYTAITVDNLDGILQAVTQQTEETAGYKGIVRYQFPGKDVLEDYQVRAKELVSTLWILNVPLLLMLVFYIFMMSSRIAAFERNEMAVLRSRGASRGQVLLVYLLQALLLSGMALLIGLPCSLLFCRAIGSVTGFLQFDGTLPFPVTMSRNAVVYALTAIALFIVIMLLPIVFSRDFSIVHHKQKKAGKATRPLWNKLFADFWLIGLALYGYYVFRNRQKLLAVSGNEASIEPLLFIVSIAFILGCALLFVRLYPPLIHLCYRLFRRWWSPVGYYSLLNVCRSGTAQQFISIFLIFTVSMGIFNAVSARTLNRNREDRIAYAAGADITLKEYWQPLNTDGLAADPDETVVFYREPPFSRFRELEGAASVTRVYDNARVNVTVPSHPTKQSRLLGILPPEFAVTVFNRGDLYAEHFYAYMNLLSARPDGILVSRSLLDELKLSVGDTLWIQWGRNTKEIPCVIQATVDYFPTYIPADGHLIVGNLPYLQSLSKLEPYGVYIKKADGVSSEILYGQMREAGIGANNLIDATEQIQAYRRDPLIQGTNGSLTLAFLIVMLITLIGFTLYWVISLKSRMLQFGILRSMGFTKTKLFFTLVWEQVLVSFASIVAGGVIGTAASCLYVPFVEMNVPLAQQIPPFVTIFLAEDYRRILILAVGIVLVGMLMMRAMTVHLKPGQLLKLGED